MKLIVGLGNPGKEYEHTRHNMGYDAIDRFGDTVSAIFDHNKFNGDFAIVNHESLPEKIILAKPLTFMNNSGEFVRPLMDYFKLTKDDLIVVYDDMALAPGKIRLRLNGSHGSHNGMRSIIDHLKTDDFKRIRIGIGEPVHKGVDWVLGKASGEELTQLETGVDLAAKAIRDTLLHSFEYAMNKYN